MVNVLMMTKIDVIKYLNEIYRCLTDLEINMWI